MRELSEGSCQYVVELRASKSLGANIPWVLESREIVRIKRFSGCLRNEFWSFGRCWLIRFQI
jgi:hypothetical protein